MNTIGLSLLSTTHPHTIWNKSPPLPHPRIFFRRYFLHFSECQKTHIVRPLLYFWTAHLSDQITGYHSSFVNWQCAFTHSKCFLAWSSVNNARSTALQFRIPSSHSRHRIVLVETSELVMLCNASFVSSVWSPVVQMKYRLNCTAVFHGHSGWDKFSSHLRVSNRDGHEASLLATSPTAATSILSVTYKMQFCYKIWVISTLQHEASWLSTV